MSGWSGAGYIIFDPVTGSGAYKIGGGKNGSYLFEEEIKRIKEECSQDPSAGLALDMLLTALVGIGQQMDNIKDITKWAGLLTAIVKFAADTTRTFWKISEVSKNEEYRIAAEKIVNLSILVGIVALGINAFFGGTATLIVTIMYLTMLSAAIQAFAVKLAAGCYPMSRET